MGCEEMNPNADRMQRTRGSLVQKQENITHEGAKRNKTRIF